MIYNISTLRLSRLEIIYRDLISSGLGLILSHHLTAEYLFFILVEIVCTVLYIILAIKNRILCLEKQKENSSDTTCIHRKNEGRHLLQNIKFKVIIYNFFLITSTLYIQYINEQNRRPPVNKTPGEETDMSSIIICFVGVSFSQHLNIQRLIQYMDTRSHEKKQEIKLSINS